MSSVGRVDAVGTQDRASRPDAARPRRARTHRAAETRAGGVDGDRLAPRGRVHLGHAAPASSSPRCTIDVTTASARRDAHGCFEGLLAPLVRLPSGRLTQHYMGQEAAGLKRVCGIVARPSARHPRCRWHGRGGDQWQSARIAGQRLVVGAALVASGIELPRPRADRACSRAWSAADQCSRSATISVGTMTLADINDDRRPDLSYRTRRTAGHGFPNLGNGDSSWPARPISRVFTDRPRSRWPMWRRPSPRPLPQS
jgi:hypothetical protein